MCHSLYTELWKTTQSKLLNVLPLDHALQTSEGVKDKAAFYAEVARLYVKYAELVKGLDQCYDQVVQPQKRPLIRRLLDMCIGRMLELKHEMVQLDQSDYNYFDRVLIEMKTTPFDVDGTTTRYFREGRADEVADRHRAMDRILNPPAELQSVMILAESQPTMVQTRGSSAVVVAIAPSASGLARRTSRPILPGVRRSSLIRLRSKSRMSMLWRRSRMFMATPESELPMTRELAILIIQRHERARNGRGLFLVWRDLSRLKDKVARGEKIHKQDEALLERAARLIQKAWRIYNTKHKARRREIREALLLGTLTPSWMPTAARKRAEEVCALRRILQAQNQRDFEDANVREKEKFLKVKGPYLTDDYTDELRAWFVEWYEKTFRFPDFPPEEEGGSLKVVAHQVITPEEYLDEVEEKRKIRDRKTGDKDKAKKEAEKKKAKEKADKEKAKEKEKEEKEKERLNKGVDDEEVLFKVKLSIFTPPLSEANDEYNHVWRPKDESDNPLQKFDLSMVQQEKREECELELRRLVDEMMRAELDVLNAALERDRMKRTGKKSKGGKKKEKKGKKGKKGKKKKHDMTADRTTEDLFEELVSCGVIRKYPKVYLKDFLADHSYVNADYRRMEKDPLPALAEVKQVVLEYCILPLGSPIVHRLAPLTKSVCIVGPAGSGKHMLANAVCTELGAVLFDLTPSNLAGKYPGKDGLKMLVHLIDKMSRLLQPSILFMDGAEKPFYKKVPKPERKTEPRRLKKHLGKIVKGITPEDQVLLLGISKEPFAARPPVVKLYNRWIFLPRPDYGTVQLAWQKLLMQYHSVDRYFPTWALTMETQGYSLGTLARCVQSTMTVDRVLRLAKEPLTPHELLEYFLRLPRVTDQDMSKLLDWYNKKVPQAKRRAAAMKVAEEKREQLAKLKKGKTK